MWKSRNAQQPSLQSRSVWVLLRDVRCQHMCSASPGQLLLHSHSQCSSASPLSAFPEQLLVSRPSGQVSLLRLCHREEQATGAPRGFPDPAASITPPSSSDHWKEGSGHCLTGPLVKANLPQGFSHRGLFVWAYLFFAFPRQSGCNFGSRLSVWLLYPSLLTLPFSPVAALQAVSVWVIPPKTYTQTHIRTLELTPTRRHSDQGENSSEVSIWISWLQDLSSIVMLCSDCHDLYHLQFSFQLLFCSTFRISQGSFIQVYVFWFVSASLCNLPLLKSQGKKNNTQEQNMWLVNQILGKTQIFQWNRIKCKELSPWEESQAGQGWRLWIIGLFPLAGSLNSLTGWMSNNLSPFIHIELGPVGLGIETLCYLDIFNTASEWCLVLALTFFPHLH